MEDLQVKKNMTMEEELRLYPRIYHIAKAVLGGVNVSQGDATALRSWLDHANYCTLLVHPDAYVELADSEADVCNNTDEEIEDNGGAQKCDDNRFLSDEERAHRKMLHDFVSGKQVTFPFDKWRVRAILSEIFGILAVNETGLKKTIELLRIQIDAWKDNPSAYDAAEETIRSYDYLLNGPSLEFIDQLRRRYDVATNNSGSEANLVINMCFELGVKLNPRDVMLLHSPSTFGLSKTKFEPMFKVAEEYLRYLIDCDEKYRGEPILYHEYVLSKKIPDFRSSVPIFCNIDIWRWTQHSYFEKKYEDRFRCVGLNWPHNASEEVCREFYRLMRCYALVSEEFPGIWQDGKKVAEYYYPKSRLTRPL